MMTRDEILTAISIERFSVRRVFYGTLDGFTHRAADGTGERIKITWPDALGVLSIENWNDAYHMTMVWKTAQANRERAQQQSSSERP